MLDAGAFPYAELHHPASFTLHSNQQLMPQSSSDSLLGEEIAKLVLDTFAKLPPKCKPGWRTPTIREWVPLAGIVLQRGAYIDSLQLSYLLN
jgi:hypothetical protein